MKKLVVLLPVAVLGFGLLSLISIRLFSNVAAAVESTFGQKILPKDCRFDVVDAGTQQLTYYTPRECGIPFVDEPPVLPKPTAKLIEKPATTSQSDSDGVIAAPIVLSPNDGDTIVGNTVFINGTAVPQSTLRVYQDGAIVGAVITAADGRWSFTYTADNSAVALQFETCVGLRCSLRTDSLRLTFDRDVTCVNPGFLSLETYQFFDIPAGVPIELVPNPFDSSADVRIDWGDGTNSFYQGHQSGNTYKKTYERSGQYGGSMQVLISDTCSIVKHFTVTVIPESAISRFYTTLAIIGSASFIFLLYRIIISTVKIP